MSTTPGAGFRLYYLADPGAHAYGYATFSWLQLDARDWTNADQAWRRYRDRLHHQHGIPADQVLNPLELITRPTGTSGARPAGRRTGVTIVRESLAGIAALPGLRVGTVYRRHQPERPVRTRYDLYEALIAHLDTDLRANAATGIAFLNGDHHHDLGDAHQSLDVPGRALIEDPQPRTVYHDQWAQMSRLVAWCAYEHIARRTLRHRIWHWYPDIFADIDRHRGPRTL